MAKDEAQGQEDDSEGALRMSLDTIYVLLTILGVAAIFGAVLRWRMGKNPPESEVL